MSELLKAFFESRTREELLRLLVSDGITASESELARRCGVSPKAVANEVRKLSQAGLIEIEVAGSAHLVKLKQAHPAVRPLRDLFRACDSDCRPGLPPAETEVREALAFWGAPLTAWDPVEHMPIEQALLEGLRAARKDGTILRVLPIVLAKHLGSLDWRELIEGARKSGLKAELGVLVDLTADLLGDGALAARAKSLKDRRRRRVWYLPEPRVSYDRQLAELNTPDAVRHWGVRMNVGRDSFASLLEKHLA